MLSTLPDVPPQQARLGARPGIMSELGPSYLSILFS